MLATWTLVAVVGVGIVALGGGLWWALADFLLDRLGTPAAEWPPGSDEDGDGYYADKTGEPLMGCDGLPGYAALGGDCGPDDPAQSPGAEELCNFVVNGVDGNSVREFHSDAEVGERPQQHLGSIPILKEVIVFEHENGHAELVAHAFHV